MSSVTLSNCTAFQYNKSVSSDLTSLCDPLKYLGITHFGYLNFFKDGTYFKVSNNLGWVENYLKNNLADKTEAFAETLKPVPLNLLNYQVWPQTKGNDCISALHEFGIGNGINFQIKMESSIEVFYFATDKNNDNALCVYEEHLDNLKKFIFYFKDKAKEIINTSDRKKLAIQEGIPFFQAATQPFDKKEQNQNLKNFLHAMDTHRYYLNGKNSHTYLTKQEAHCMKYLSKGKTAKEIGKLINLSSRTVESYINNVKIKTNSCATSQAIDIFLDSCIGDILN